MLKTMGKYYIGSNKILVLETTKKSQYSKQWKNIEICQQNIYIRNNSNMIWFETIASQKLM